MTKPMRLAEFQILPPRVRGHVSDGLAVAIDRVATAAAPSHRFLRFGWYAAALEAYGGAARTLVVDEEGRPTLALPFVDVGPRVLGFTAVPGCYWPFRSFVLSEGAGRATIRAALATLATTVNALRIGPLDDDDAAAGPLLAAARAAGWGVLDRFVADSWRFDLGAARRGGEWPRGSTLRKNRFHEKHLADHGALEWQSLRGGEVVAAFDAFAAVEARSWIGARTDGSDAKFTATGHGAFWRAAALDPGVAAMLRGALLRVDGVPAAFSFDIEAGTTRYAIANSYDPVFARCSVGKLLQYRNLVRAADDGVETIDWGAGDSGYKQVIGATRGPALRDWLLLRPGLPAGVGRLAAGLWQRSGRQPVAAGGPT
jgi:CelD/BcsL family acetyltransferase involved in cellulose biosynthesis